MSEELKFTKEEVVKELQKIRKSKFNIFSWFEAKRLSFWTLLAALVLIPDKSSMTVLFAIGIVSLCTIMAHLVRKTLFPYLDFRELCESAAKDPQASAKIVMSLVFLNAVIIWAVISLLR
jgi:hypothetical protein